MALKLIHFIGFQVGWFASILGAAEGRSYMGPIVVGTLILLHLFFVMKRGRELKRLLAAAIIGFLADTALVALGVLAFDSAWESLAPIWMVGLWLNFAATLAVTMDWLRFRYLLSAILGAIFGPISYVAGERLGALSFPAGNELAIGYVAFEWACAMPLLVYLTERWACWFSAQTLRPSTDGGRKNP